MRTPKPMPILTSAEVSRFHSHVPLGDPCLVGSCLPWRGELTKAGYGQFTIVRHPLRERLDDALMSCRLHEVIAGWSRPMQPPGRYRVERGRSEGYLTWNWSAAL